jgi:hypothetical protein
MLRRELGLSQLDDNGASTQKPMSWGAEFRCLQSIHRFEQSLADKQRSVSRTHSAGVLIRVPRGFPDR